MKGATVYCLFFSIQFYVTYSLSIATLLNDKSAVLYKLSKCCSVLGFFHTSLDIMHEAIQCLQILGQRMLVSRLFKTQ